MNYKFKKHLIKELEKCEEIHLMKVFEYLKELEEEMKGYSNKRMQKAIYHLCETGEIISSTVVELECLDNE
jgi:hypothetical protein